MISPLPRVEKTTASEHKSQTRVEQTDKNNNAPSLRVTETSLEEKLRTPTTTADNYNNDAIKHHTWQCGDLRPTQSRYLFRNTFHNYQVLATQYLLAQHLLSPDLLYGLALGNLANSQPHAHGERPIRTSKKYL